MICFWFKYLKFIYYLLIFLGQIAASQYPIVETLHVTELSFKRHSLFFILIIDAHKQTPADAKMLLTISFLRNRIDTNVKFTRVIWHLQTYWTDVHSYCNLTRESVVCKSCFQSKGLLLHSDMLNKYKTVTCAFTDCITLEISMDEHGSPGNECCSHYSLHSP